MAFSFYSKVILPIKPNLQDTNYDCGAASLEIILQSLGRHVSEERLVELTHTNTEGTQPENLVTALIKLGVRHEVIPEGNLELIEEKIKLLNLCLVEFQISGANPREYKNLEAGHYSVIFGYDKSCFWVADPASHRELEHPHRFRAGIRKIEKEIFKKRWIDIETSNVIHKHWMIAVPLTQIALP